MNYCVVTTINNPTAEIGKLYRHFGQRLIVVMDKKTPIDWRYRDLVPVGEFPNQLYAPDNHYARKNTGYIEAIQAGARVIYDTDDDNMPNENWQLRAADCFSHEVSEQGWCNIYSFFTKRKIWPRGFSLRHINNIKKYLIPVFDEKHSAIQQGLANNYPDVDAIFRLTQREDFFFGEPISIWLGKNTWCPFNSQSTWWFNEAFPLLYLPVTASFRMTDIWRSFVAQRCLWEIGQGVTFHSPAEVIQVRNPHDLLKDFEQEVDGYLKNDMIVYILENLELKQGVENMCENLLTCYKALVKNNIVKETELLSLKEWITDIQKIWKP